MTDSFKIRGRLAFIGIMLVITTVVACGKEIPVQELDAARQEIDAATAENASEYAADDYSDAREALLEAHQDLADDDLSEARVNALRAQGLALQARQTAAPKNTTNKSSDATTAIASADEAYSEVLAPRDFASAKELFDDGTKLEDSASNLISEEGSIKEGIQNYSEAARKYQASSDAANKARNLSLSQKGDILDSLAGIRSKLEKAETYGASQEDPNALASARLQLSEAESLINADKLKEGNAKMKLADMEALSLLSNVEGKYASNKLAEAKTAVNNSQGLFASIDTEANKNTYEKKAVITTLSEQVGAAGEALRSSENSYSSSNYSSSINESEEAIRLSNIIYEQSNMLARARNANLDIGGSDETPIVVKKETVVEQPVYTNDGYKVQVKDSLWSIARQRSKFGNGHYWKRIYKANKSKISNPNLIYPGQTLYIPSKKGPISEKGQTLEEQLKEEARKKAQYEMEQARENVE